MTNGPKYLRSQLNLWTLRTFNTNGVAVDGTYNTVRFNAKDAEGPDMSYGIYQLAMPPSHFVVAFDDRRPGTSTITILPIVVAVTMQKQVRILAPAGYLWDCSFFRYKAPGAGVPPSLVVEGAEADMPINDGPPTPNAEPKNRITLDTLQAPWVQGVVYGFTLKAIWMPRRILGMPCIRKSLLHKWRIGVHGKLGLFTPQMKLPHRVTALVNFLHLDSSSL